MPNGFARTVRHASFAAALALGALPPARARAQEVRGQVVDRVSGAGIAGAFVILLDGNGVEVGRTLTEAGGRFLLRAPTAGAYRLQSRRIGFRAFSSSLLTLAAGQTVDYRLTVEAIPLPLPEVIVEGKPLCGTRGEEGSLVARLWDEAREALGEVAWTTRQPYRYELDLYQRGLDPYDRSIKSERSWSASGYYRTPFQSAPPEQLVKTGYIVTQDRTRTFYGPDVDVLRSDPFVQTHCFRVVAGKHADSALVGLTFVPVKGHDVPDVRGTIWLDKQSAELSRVDFEYVHLPDNLPEGPGRGRVAYFHLPSGAWVVREWRIAIPILGLKPVFGRRVVGLAGVQENGGRVVRVTDDGRVLYAADLATLNGTVVDSTGARPLAGATVRLVNTTFTTTSDSAGRFQFAGSMDGVYQVAFTHPRLDSLGYTPAAVPVTLHVGTAASVALAVPSESTIVRQLCPDSVAPDSRVVLGAVRATSGADSATPDAVRVSWHDTTSAAPGGLAEELARLGLKTYAAAAPLDSAGRYLMCGVPVGPLLVVQVVRGATPVAITTLRFTPGGVFAGDGYSSMNAGARIWREDLVAGAAEGTGAIVMRAVDRVSGRPIAAAVVSLEGTERTTVTDHAGHAVLASVRAGSQLLAVRRIGYQMLERVVTVRSGDTLRLGPQVLEPVPFVLDTAVVSAQAEDRMLRISGFFDRRKLGFGDFITRNQFDRYRPSAVTDILRRLPSLSVRPNPWYGKAKMDPISRRPSGEIDYRHTIFESRRNGKYCPMSIFLNGAFVGSEDYIDVDDLIDPAEIEAAETYPAGGSVPVEFNVTGSECGVVVLWTRR